MALAGGGNPGDVLAGEPKVLGGVNVPTKILRLGLDIFCGLGWKFMVWLLVMKEVALPCWLAKKELLRS